MPDEKDKPELTFTVGSSQSAYKGAAATAVRVAATEALPALAQALGPAVTKFQEALKDARLAPDEIELEMGAKLEGKFSWGIVAGGEAEVILHLKWIRKA